MEIQNARGKILKMKMKVYEKFQTALTIAVRTMLIDSTLYSSINKDKEPSWLTCFIEGTHIYLDQRLFSESYEYTDPSKNTTITLTGGDLIETRWFIFAHELLHIVLEHVPRSKMIGDRNLWNIAADHVVNDVLFKSGFKTKLPCVKLEDAPENISVEGLYRLLLKKAIKVPKGGTGGIGNDIQPDQKNNDGSGENKDKEKGKSNKGNTESCAGACGSEKGSGLKGERGYANERADIAKSIGDTPGFNSREWSLANQANKDLSSLLTNISKSYIFGTGIAQWHGNRKILALNRFKGSRIVLPIHLEKICNIGIIIDTSGSIYGEELDKFMTFVNNIMALYKQKSKASKVYCTVVDADVHFSQCINHTKDIKLKGGGGTDMRLGFRELEKSKIKFDAVFCLTDGYTPWPDPQKDRIPYKFYCVLIDAGNPAPPFGKTIII